MTAFVETVKFLRRYLKDTQTPREVTPTGTAISYINRLDPQVKKWVNEFIGETATTREPMGDLSVAFRVQRAVIPLTLYLNDLTQSNNVVSSDVQLVECLNLQQALIIVMKHLVPTNHPSQPIFDQAYTAVMTVNTAPTELQASLADAVGNVVTESISAVNAFNVWLDRAQQKEDSFRIRVGRWAKKRLKNSQ